MLKLAHMSCDVGANESLSDRRQRMNPKDVIMYEATCPSPDRPGVLRDDDDKHVWQSNTEPSQNHERSQTFEIDLPVVYPPHTVNKLLASVPFLFSASPFAPGQFSCRESGLARSAPSCILDLGRQHPNACSIGNRE